MSDIIYIRRGEVTLPKEDPNAPRPSLVVEELPEAFVESTTNAELCQVRKLLQEGLGLERRGDDHEARAHFVNALQRVARHLALNGSIFARLRKNRSTFFPWPSG